MNHLFGACPFAAEGLPEPLYDCYERRCTDLIDGRACGALVRVCNNAGDKLDVRVEQGECPLGHAMAEVAIQELPPLYP